MKKIICVFIVLTMLIMIVSCGETVVDTTGSTTAATTAATTETAITTEATNATEATTAAEGTPSEPTPDYYFKFTLNEDNASYSVGAGTYVPCDVVIPATYNGLPVTKISGADPEKTDVRPGESSGGFDRSGIKSIVIPDGVTSIGYFSFAECTRLTSVTIPDSVNEIDLGAFSGCTSLVSVKIPKGVTSLGPATFGNCTSLVSVTIPVGVTLIDHAFHACPNLSIIEYEGTEEQWNAIRKYHAFNEDMGNYTVHCLGLTAEETTEATTEATTASEPTLAEILADGETEATSVFTDSNNGVNFTVTVHGYSNRGKGYDFYVKSNDYIIIDVKVTNNKSTAIYQLAPYLGHGYDPSPNVELNIGFDDGNGHRLSFAHESLLLECLTDLWSIDAGDEYSWRLRAAAAYFEESNYDLEPDSNDRGEGLKFYDESIYSGSMCEFSGTITFVYSDTNNGNSTVNDLSITANVTIPVLYVK